MRKLLFFAWLPLVVFLFPLPPQAAKNLIDEVDGPRTAGQLNGATGKQPNVTGTAEQQASSGELDMIKAALWDRWVENLVLLTAGLAVGFVAWRGYKHWEWFALGMSLFYLTLVVFRYLAADRPVPDGALFFETSNHVLRGLQANLRLLETGITNGSFMRPAWLIYREILMPMFQVVVLAWLLRLYLKRKPRLQ